MLRQIVHDTEKVLRDVLGTDMPWTAIGEEHLPKPGGCPAIVWIPGRGPITGGRQAIDQSQEGTPSNMNPAPIFQRNLACNAYVFAENFDATETLFGHLIAALHRAVPGRWTPTGESWSMGWPTATEEPSDTFQSGTLCIVTFELRMALVREADTDLTDLDLSLEGEIETEEFPQ